MEPSGSNRPRVPLGDITNGNQDNHSQQTEYGDRNARRYASMSTEMREEQNRKQRERRKVDKNQDDLSAQLATQDEGTICHATGTDLTVLSESRVPLGDITNNITQGNQDTHGS